MHAMQLPTLHYQPHTTTQYQVMKQGGDGPEVADEMTAAEIFQPPLVGMLSILDSATLWDTLGHHSGTLWDTTPLTVFFWESPGGVHIRDLDLEVLDVESLDRCKELVCNDT